MCDIGMYYVTGITNLSSTLCAWRLTNLNVRIVGDNQLNFRYFAIVDPLKSKIESLGSNKQIKD